MGPAREGVELDGPFTAGTQGWSKQKGYGRNRITLTAVEEGRRWQATTPLPSGTGSGSHNWKGNGPIVR